MTYSGRVEQEKQNKRMEIRLPESELAAVELAAGKNKSEWAREAFRAALSSRPLETPAAVTNPPRSGSAEATAPTDRSVSLEVPADALDATPVLGRRKSEDQAPSPPGVASSA